MSIKHTPGPWVIDSDGDGKANAIVTSTHLASLDDDICEVYGGNKDDDDIRKANASLIAAAPDLLEALRKADALLKNASMGRERTTLPAGNSFLDLLAGYMHPDEINGACDAVIAAIAKATGEPVA